MPLLWISLLFITGLALGANLLWYAAGWLWLGGLSLLSWPILRRLPQGSAFFTQLCWMGRVEPRLMIPPILLLAALFFGAARIAVHVPDVNHGHVAAFNDTGIVRLQAIVCADPDRRDQSTLLRLEVEEVTAINEDGSLETPRPAHGYLLAYIPGRVPWQYGDRLLLEGKPVTPPEGEEFSYRDFLARKDVYTYLTYPKIRLIEIGAGNPLLAAIYRLREWAYHEIYHLFPSPEAPLLAGILLGLERDIPEDIGRAFRDTGTAHIIAISGFNIAILAQLFSNLFGKVFSRWWAMVAAIAAVCGYTILVGAAASVMRAAIMGSMALLAQQLGRRSTGFNGLALTAAAMCLFNPRLPWDPSFQLSFMATLGLMVYGDRFQGGFTNWLEQRLPVETARKIAAPVGEYILLTLAAQLMTLPVILYHFQRLSISSFLANPLILPAQPLVMILSGLAVIAGLVSDPLAHLLASLAWPLSAYTIRVVEWMAQIQWGVLVLDEFNMITVALMYTVVLSPLFSDRFPTFKKNVLKPSFIITIIGLTAAFFWRGAQALPDNHLHLIVFDMNGSQVVLVQAPRGETVLINGGDSVRLLNEALGRRLSPIHRQIDGLVLNTSEASGFSSLTRVLEGYPASQVLWGSDSPRHRAGEQLNKYLRRKAVSAKRMAQGDTIAIGNEARIAILATDPQGSALLLEWQSFRALLPGGIDPHTLRAEDVHNLGVLILEQRDLERTTADQWMQYMPQSVIYTTDFAEENEIWLIPRPQGWISVETDGLLMWLEKK
jgi:competence protein ComEC